MIYLGIYWSYSLDISVLDIKFIQRLGKNCRSGLKLMLCRGFGLLKVWLTSPPLGDVLVVDAFLAHFVVVWI